VPPTESKLRNGVLTIDAVPFATQASNVRLSPKTDEVGDALEVLSGDVLEPSDKTDWTLVIEALQDFDDPAGFVNFTLTNAGDVVTYTWKPNDTATGVTYSGTVRIRPVEIGGDVNDRLTTSAEWPCQETPTVAYAP
jgi:hypothetical protein